MGRRILITEEEKNHINKLYGFISEQGESTDYSLTQEDINQLYFYTEFSLTKCKKSKGHCVGGGGLSWNDNIVPSPLEKDTMDRFLKYYENMWHGNDDMNPDIPFSVKEPYLEKAYKEILLKHWYGKINLRDSNRLGVL